MKCIRVDRDFYIVDLRSKNEIVQEPLEIGKKPKGYF